MSSWSDFSDQVVKLGSAGVDAYKTFTSDAPAPAAATAAPAPSGLPKWLVPAGLAAVVLVIVLVFVGKK